MTELATLDDLSALLSGGDVAAVFNALMEDLPEKPQRSTVATRKAETRKAIEKFDLDRLISLQDKMAKIIDTLTANELDAEHEVLTGEQAAALMSELLDEREVAELLDVRKEMIKEAVFAHLDRTVGPNTSGDIPVPEHGKRFCREGAGHGTPAVDEQRLQALLGDRFVEACEEEIVPAQVIPERIEYRLSLEKVLVLARKDHAILEALRSCLVPGKLRSPRFVVRDL